MSLPTSSFTLLAYLALIVPGIVFGVVRSRLRGFVKTDTQVGARVLLAFVVSAVFDAVYAALFGWYVLGRVGDGGNPSALEVVGWSGGYLGLAVVVPACVSWLLYVPGGTIASLARQVKSAANGAQFDSVPTAWDHAAVDTTANWVRVRLAPGDWVGGRFGRGSYFSTYPEPHDLFIEEQWKMSDDGEFTAPVENAAGLWLKLREDSYVEWIYGEPETRED